MADNGGGDSSTTLIMVAACGCFCIIFLALGFYGYQQNWFEGLFTSTSTDTTSTDTTDVGGGGGGTTDTTAPTTGGTDPAAGTTNTTTDALWGTAADATFGCKVNDTKYGRWGWEGDAKGKCCDKNFQNCEAPSSSAGAAPVAPPAGQCNISACDNWMAKQVLANANFDTRSNGPPECAGCKPRMRWHNADGTTRVWKEGCAEQTFTDGKDAFNSGDYLSVLSDDCNIGVGTDSKCQTNKCVDQIHSWIDGLTSASLGNASLATGPTAAAYPNMTNLVRDCSSCPYRAWGSNTGDSAIQARKKLTNGQMCTVRTPVNDVDAAKALMKNQLNSFMQFSDNSCPGGQVAAGGVARKTRLRTRARAGGSSKKGVAKKKAAPKKVARKRGGPSKPVMLRR